MKFRLRTLLALVTVVCVVTAVSLRIISHQNAIREHGLALQKVGDGVSSLQLELREYILRMPAVAAQLQASNPINPSMALSHTVIGRSTALGTFGFTRTFHYHWQLVDGSRCQGIKVTVDSVRKDDSLDDHVVRLTYEPGELNDEVATWIGRQLEQNECVQITHVKLARKPRPVAQMPVGGKIADETLPTVWGGIR